MRKQRAAQISVVAAIALVAAKLTAGLMTNSLALLSEAGHSTIDLLAAFVSLVVIINAGRPPDHEHHFGHAKFESLGALVELSFLIVLAGVIIERAMQRLTSTTHPEVTLDAVSAILIGLTISVDIWRTVSLFRAAKETGSEALSASAMHFFSDLLGTLMVAFGLLMTAAGFPGGDSIAALAIAVMVLLLSYRLGRRVFSSLADKAPEGISFSVQEIVLCVEHVRDVHDIRVRQAGSQLFTEMHVGMDPAMTLEDAHHVMNNIEAALRDRWPAMHVVTHPEPEGADYAALPPPKAHTRKQKSPRR